MSGRPSQRGSASIPIPRSLASSSRNIEAVLSIPFISPSIGTQPSSIGPQRHISSSPRRASAHGPLRVGTSIPGLSTSPVHSTHRPSSSTQTRTSSFEPRVIRAPGREVPTIDTECISPLLPSQSSARRRSVSVARAGASRSVPMPTRPVSIPCPTPSYLEFSALRHLIHTDPAVLPVASRKQQAPPTRPQSYPTAMSPASDNEDDGSSSPSLRDSPLPSLSAPAPDQRLKLPTRWSDEDRAPDLNVSMDGRELCTSSSFTVDQEAAAIRTTHPIPPACGIFYYEVEVLGKEQKAHIGIGFAASTVKLNRLPGWESHSWGYYGDSSLNSDKKGIRCGPFGAGDTIGCGIDFTTHKVFYTKNGSLLSASFESVGRNMDLYPTVGLQYPSEPIRTNFGQEPFIYDIDSHVQQQRNATWKRIMTIPLDSIPTSGSSTSSSDRQTKAMLDQLVHSYLIHHGYARTARTFEKSIAQDAASSSGQPEDADVEMQGSPVKTESTDIDIERRTSIVNTVLEGDIDSALQGLEQHYPAVLDADGQFMLFKLRCRKFIELMLITSEIRKTVKRLKEKEKVLTKRKIEATHDEFLMDEEMGMEVDDDASGMPGLVSTKQNGDGEDVGNVEGFIREYEAALNEAILYGQKLSKDYQTDPREELQEIFKKTCGIVAWEDPSAADSPIADFVGRGALVTLAHEINDAILKSQGRPARPALETLYRHTSACILELGLRGVGSAAYADMRREFLQ